MRIDFKDGGWVEIVRAKAPGKVTITVAAKDSENSLTKHLNAAEVTEDEFKQMVKEILTEDDQA